MIADTMIIWIVIIGVGAVVTGMATLYSMQYLIG